MAIEISTCQYHDLKDMVLDEIAYRTKKENKETNSVLGQSEYWADFCDFFRYVYYLPEWELRRIRRHTFHLTSDLYQRYYFADKGFRNAIENGYNYFIDQLDGFCIDEGTQGIGIKISDQILSHDLLRYLGTLVDLTKSGAIDKPTSTDVTQTILEIGGGYGGLARCIQKYKSNIAYVIVDLEETIFFSMCYLKEQLPEKHLYFVSNLDTLQLEPNSIYFVPQHRFEVLGNLNFDLAISQQSLQEMTSNQVRRYLNFVKNNVRHLYSCNLVDHGQLALEKSLITGLDNLLSTELGLPQWVGQWPTEGNFFGDNHLNRKLYKVQKNIHNNIKGNLF